jgi:hypothetical protein
MNLDRYLSFDAKDVAVRLHCTRCNTSVRVAPSALKRDFKDKLIRRCPNCEVDWVLTADDPLVKLLSTLQELTTTPKMTSDKHFAVSFDVVAPANLFEDGQ